ncbi:MAG: hypothetical protein LBD93_02590 [Treponema sp.]|nr:hypothetical protein [Treponema sp.]
MVEFIFGQIQDRFEEPFQDGDIAHIAEEEFERLIVQRRDEGLVVLHKSLRLYMGSGCALL